MVEAGKSHDQGISDGSGRLQVVRTLPLPAGVVFDELIDRAGQWVPMTVAITKIGPVLTGVVMLRVVSLGQTSSRLEWDERIRVPCAPQFLAAPIAAAARQGFSSAISRMVKRIRSRSAP